MKTQITFIIQTFLAQFSTKVLAGAPKFVFTTNKVIVQVPYYTTSEALLTETKINALVTRLSTLYGHHVVASSPRAGGHHSGAAGIVELRLVQLQYPYLDSSILGQYIALNAGKYNFLRMKKRLFKKQACSRSEPSHLPS